MRFRHLVICLGLLICYATAAAQPAVRLQEVTTDQGLSQIHINAIVQDDFGFVWLATKDGLNRYDGTKCKVYSPSFGKTDGPADNEVTCLAAGKGGKLYIGYANGKVDVLDIAQERFTPLTFPEALKPDEMSQWSALLEDSRGLLWLCNANGNIYRRDPTDGQIRIVSAYKKQSGEHPYFPGSELQEFNGKMYAITIGIGLQILDLQTGASLPLPVAFADAGIDPKEIWRTVPVDARRFICTLNEMSVNSTFYIGTEDHLQVLPSLSNVLGGQNPQMDRRGRIWFCNEGLLHCYDSNRLTDAIVPVASDALFLNGITMQDKSGLIWGGSIHGAFFFNPDTPFECMNAKTSGQDTLIAPSQYFIREDPFHPGSLYLGGLAGMQSWHKDASKAAFHSISTNFEGGTTNGYISALDIVPLSADRIITTGAREPLPYSLRNGNWHWDPLPGTVPDFTGYRPREFYEAPDGAIFYGYESTIVQYDPIRGVVGRFDIPHDKGNATNEFFQFMEDSTGILWAASDQGLFWLDRHSVKTGKWDIGQTLHLKSIALIGEELWMGTDGLGIVRANREDILRGGKALQVLGIESGLPNNVVYATLEDSLGRVWVSTNKGLAVYLPSEHAFRTFSVAWGLQNSEFNTGAWCNASDGMFWFGGVEGANRFHPNQVVIPKPTAPFTFTGYAIGDESELHSLIGSAFKPLVLDPGNNNLTVEFAILDFFKTGTGKTAYRLLGDDSAWVDLGGDQRITFRQLAAGDYRLQVRATDRWGNWVESAVLKMSLLPHWYQTLWFWLILAALFALFVVAAARVRIRRRLRVLEWQKLQLEAVVADRTEELREKNIVATQSLAQRESLLREVHHRVKNNLEVISSLLNLQADASKGMDGFEALQQSRGRIASMALVHERLYQHETLSEIEMQDYLESLIDNIETGFLRPDLAVTKSIEAGGTKLDISTAIPIGLIVNEVITNAFKYAFVGRESGCIQVSLRQLIEGEMELLIADDGVGMPATAQPVKRKSLGLRLVEDLAQQLQGKYELLPTPPGGGTCLRIVFWMSAFHKWNEL